LSTSHSLHDLSPVFLSSSAGAGIGPPPPGSIRIG
jgi:hypothetical protein